MIIELLITMIYIQKEKYEISDTKEFKGIDIENTNEQIEELFEEILGLPYDDNCYYNILEEE